MIFVRTVISSWKSARKFCLVQIRGVLNGDFVSNLIFNIIPEVFFQILNLTVLIPKISALVFLFKFLCHLLPHSKCQGLSVIFKRLALSKLLKSLKSGWNSRIIAWIKHTGRFPRGWRLYLAPSLFPYSWISIDTLYILYRIFKFFLCWVKCSQSGNIFNSIFVNSRFYLTFPKSHFDELVFFLRHCFVIVNILLPSCSKLNI